RVAVAAGRVLLRPGPRALVVPAAAVVAQPRRRVDRPPGRLVAAVVEPGGAQPEGGAPEVAQRLDAAVRRRVDQAQHRALGVGEVAALLPARRRATVDPGLGQPAPAQLVGVEPPLLAVVPPLGPQAPVLAVAVLRPLVLSQLAALVVDDVGQLRRGGSGALPP